MAPFLTQSVHVEMGLEALGIKPITKSCALS